MNSSGLLSKFSGRWRLTKMMWFIGRETLLKRSISSNKGRLKSMQKLDFLSLHTSKVSILVTSNWFSRQQGMAKRLLKLIVFSTLFTKMTWRNFWTSIRTWKKSLMKKLKSRVLKISCAKRMLKRSSRYIIEMLHNLGIHYKRELIFLSKQKGQNL